MMCRLTLLGLVAAFAPVAAFGSILSITSGDALLGNRSLNLVQNGSFEADAGYAMNGSFWANGTTLGPVMTVTGWQTLGQVHTYASWGNDGTGGIRNSDNLPDGQNGMYFGGGLMGGVSLPPTFNADGTVSFTGTPSFFPKPDAAPVELWQTLSGLNTSATYLLDFWASGESAKYASFAADGIFGLDISGEQQMFFAAPSGNSGLGASQRYYVLFKPTSSSVTIKFTNWGHLIDGSGPHTELALDDVIVNQATPEPATMAIFAAGLLPLLRRRKMSA